MTIQPIIHIIKKVPWTAIAKTAGPPLAKEGSKRLTQKDQSPTKELRRIKRAYNKGEISHEEYKKMRERIVNGSTRR